MSEKLLEIRDLSVHFNTFEGVAKVLDGVCLTLYEGEVLGLIGESGSGKTVTALTVLGLLPVSAKIVSGSVYFHEDNLPTLPEYKLRNIRGSKISLVFQEPGTSLNPVAKVGGQIIDVLKLHQEIGDKNAGKGKAMELLEAVNMPRPSLVMNQYPHELSGGMQQRVAIAMAIASNPELLIADEPTSSVDVTVGKRILELMIYLKEKETISSLLFITHSFGIISEICDKVAAMYAGNIVEYGDVDTILHKCCHPYVKGLMKSVLDIHKKRSELRPMKGTIPRLINPPGGCRFHPRCPERIDKCLLEKPNLKLIAKNHFMACHAYKE